MTTYGPTPSAPTFPMRTLRNIPPLVNSGAALFPPLIWSSDTITVFFIAACVPVLFARHIQLLHDKRLGLLGKLQLALVTALLLVSIYLSWLNYNAGHLAPLTSLATRL